MDQEYFSVSQMVDMAINCYELNNTKETKKAIREAIVRDLNANGVWEQHTEEKGKRVLHFFDYPTVTQTLHVNLGRYFKKRSGEAWKRAEELNENYYKNRPFLEEILSSEENDDITSKIYYYQTDYQKKLNDVMLLALFNKFFMLDEEQLKKDLKKQEEKIDGEITPSQAAASDRTSSIQKIYENYVTPRE